METTSPLIIDFSPRPSQEDLIRAVESGMDEVDRILFQAATGSGKTVVIAHLIANILTERLYPGFKQTHTKGGWRCPQANPVKAPPQILFVVHRDKLVKQTIASFKKIFVSRVKHKKKFNERGMDTAITVIKSGEKYDFFCPIVVVSQQSLKLPRFQKMLKLGQINPKVIFYDECHTTSTNPTGIAMTKAVKPYDTKILGTTATPFWEDEEIVASEHYDVAICGRSFGELLESKELCPLLYLEPDYPVVAYEEFIDAFTKMLKTREVECQYESDTELDYMVDKWLSIDGPNLKTIAFGKSVDHGEKIVQALRRRGFNADIISYKVAEKDREDIFKNFEEGGTNVLVSVDSLGVGYDFNKIRCVMLLAPVKSLVRHWQQMGRGSRLCNEPGFHKPFCYVLDFVRNIQRQGDYGIPDTVKLTPELIMNKKPKVKREGVAPTKACPKCDFVNYASSRKCQRFDFKAGEKVYTCDHVFPIKTLAQAMQIIPGDMHRVFVPGMKLDDKDRIEMMRSLRAKRYARGHNPNAAIHDYNDSPLSSDLKMPDVNDIDTLRPFTIGAIRGKPHSMKDGEKFLAELLRLKKRKPNRWTVPIIFSIIYLEYNDDIANDLNYMLINNKLSTVEQLTLDIA